MDKRIWLAGGLALVFVLAAPALWLNDNEYTALVAAVQALGVVLALGLAIETLRADSRDRKIDRTLSLYNELVSSPLNDARVRLVNHLKEHGSAKQAASVMRDDLKPPDGRISSYGASSENPLYDANALLRYFERADAARTSGIVDYPLFHKLLAGHALWWQIAIVEGEQLPIRMALAQLAEWADEYTQSHPKTTRYMEAWERNLVRDFGDRRKVRTYA